MYQALSNLIANAIKYTPDGGSIELYSGIIKKDELSQCVANQELLDKIKGYNTDWVEIIIKDNGIGIDSDEQKHIFDRFYEVGNIDQHTSSKSAFMGGGAGLGLSICKGIVEAHGGIIWVQSKGCDIKSSNGSEFHLLLPYVDKEESAEAPPQGELNFLSDEELDLD